MRTALQYLLIGPVLIGAVILAYGGFLRVSFVPSVIRPIYRGLAIAKDWCVERLARVFGWM